jgi:hypothetical protein
LLPVSQQCCWFGCFHEIKLHIGYRNRRAAMADNRRKTATLAVPLDPEDRERWRDRAEKQGLSGAALARVLIKRELNAPEPAAA